ncbi:uncharacterized protein LOC135461915 [Liolophura sinensis]|uniref:uncharacterized protein LOC135461915 n=1 Tax=Liolophura sinensis TaxID=3198878 RepID=UPI003158E147
MMKFTLVVCLVVALMRQEANAAINVAVADFAVDCGTTVGGPVSITLTNPDPVNNNIVKMFSRDGTAACTDNDADGDDVYTIANVRTDCVDNDPLTADIEIEVLLQEFPIIVQPTDPRFTFRCIYTLGIPTLTVTDAAGNVFGGPATTEDIPVDIPGDQTYTLELLDATNAVTTTALFGDDVTLQVRMGGTDADENGVQVKQMNVSSGTISVNIIDNYCVVAPYGPLFVQDGFISAGLVATFPVTLFALEGSGSNDVTFDVEATICPVNCDGNNCGVPGKRKRRAADDEPTEDETLKLSTKLFVLPAGVQLPSSSHTTEDGSNAVTCMQSLGFIVTVAVLAVLLLVAMVIVVFMFTTRRREQQKQGA